MTRCMPVRLAVGAAVVCATLVQLETLAEAASSEPANCIGVDRSDPSWPNGSEFAGLIVDQHEFDRLNGVPASFGRSMAIAAKTDCGSE